MDKCHYYLSNGLWKIVECYFDYRNKLQNEYFWGMAVLPNHNSFGSHIVSTPWQQSWVTMDMLEASHQIEDDSQNSNDPLGLSEMNILKKEVDFQYTLRNYSSDPSVQQIFSIYSRIQTHLLMNYSEVETKAFISKLKLLLEVLLKSSPSTAHTLMHQMLQHNFFSNCCETILKDVGENNCLCSLLLCSFSKLEVFQFPMEQIVHLSQTEFQYQLNLLLIASDKINVLQYISDEEKKLYNSDSASRIKSLMENRLQPNLLFHNMILMEKHFLVQILHLIKNHVEDFSNLLKCQNIPLFIWPLVLLQCWDSGILTDDTLLQLIDKCKESTRDKTVMQITFILEWYLNFCKWCERHGASEHRSTEKEQNLLHKAKEHSVLYLINNTTDLSGTDWSQIRELLKQGKPRSDGSKQWDIVLFDGYCTLMLVLHAILSSAELDQLSRAQKTKMSDVNFLNDTFKSIYVEEVTERLKLVKKMVKSLYPLTFRLEILEDIFSLIFITFEDVKNISYFLKGTIDSSKGLEKFHARSKSVPIDKYESGKINRSFSLPPHQVLGSEKEEEGSIKKPRPLKGFICKKYILRDLIYLVKECLEELEGDPRSQLDKFQADVPCSIKNKQMENRLDRLTESVSEATWRLQLVTDPEFVSQNSIGTMQYGCGQDPHHHFDPEWIYIPQEHDRSGLLKARKKSANEKANDSGSQSQSSPGNGNSSSEVQGAKHKPPGPGIMNQMLACDSSLVVHCLAKGDVLNADHIIQLMSTEENRQTLEGELHFTESINDLKKKLQNVSLESPVRKSAPETVAKSWSLQSIQMVANQGVNSTALTNHVERFLSVSTLPSIQGAGKVSIGSMLQCIENAPAIVTIDLALTAAVTFQDFNDLLNIASKHCPELSTRVQPPISSQMTFSKPLGYIVFSQNVIALLQEINRSQINETDLEISLQQFLRAHQYPFSLKSLKDNINFWKQLRAAITDFEKDAEDSKALLNNKESAAKCQKNIKDTQKILESIIKLTETCSDFMDLGKMETSNVEISKTVNYCDLLSRYLNDIATLILDNVPSKQDDRVETVTVHSLLELSAVEIVDKLIFQYQVEPGVLEKKAQQLGFNLSATIIAGCCPRLPQVVCPPEAAKFPSSDRIILNELVPDYKSLEHQHPTRVVESILKELLIAFENYSRNKQVEGTSTESFKSILIESDIVELRNDFKIQKILEKTLELNFIRLKTLNPNEILPFFINLYNLMICHCYLSSKLEKTDGVYFNHSLYREIGYVFMGYNVGELGFVSIYDVRNKLLGEESHPMFTVRNLEAWSLVSIPTDPRVSFTMVNFRSSSPNLRLYTSEDLDAKFDEVVASYLQNNVTLSNSSLCISDFLNCYLNNVLVNQQPESHSASDSGLPTEKIKILHEFLIEHTSGELEEQLGGILPFDVSLEIKSENNELVLILDYGPLPARDNILEPQRNLDEKWVNRRLSDSILRHLSQTSRILADIVEKIHEAKEPPQTEVARDVLTEEKLKYIDYLFNASWLQSIAPLFNGNHVITALHKCPPENRLVDFFQNCINNKNWSACLDVLFALPDYCVFSELNIKRLRDVVLCEMAHTASKEGHANPWYYSQHITDVNMRLETITSNCKYWPGPVCITHLSFILRDYPSLAPELVSEVCLTIRKIRIYHAIVQNCADFAEQTWYEVSLLSNSSPHLIIQSLVKTNQLELCLQWTSLPGVLDSIRQFIDSEFILLLFNHLSHEFELIDHLLNSLPNSTLSDICDKVMQQLTSVPSISHLVQYSLRFDSSPKYRLVVIGVEMLNVLDQEEQSRLVHLISNPLLIIEQLLMNTSLNALAKVLKKVRQIEDAELINQSEVNKLITSYASKAVEFDFVKTIKSSESKQSFLLDATAPSSQEFVVPTEVPDKSQWIPDNQVSLCMCCLLVSFSMFNRRHHCRRCGRVVCRTCSLHRMKVKGYKGVAVRVCQQCHLNHTKSEGDMRCSQSTDTFDSSSFTQEFHYWKLSTDPSRNNTIREEFSFEHSPNVSLCLAIFNLLPDATYSSLLLDESEKMLKLLQLNGKSGNPEIDCGVMIQIIRSLIIGAKVKYGKAALTTGVVCCDRLLSQVDLLHLLIKNHCSRLIPTESLNSQTLRHLRDRLVEEELWGLALEVSTKCGLDRSGVWASWGKVCLAAGCWDEARSKFAHCLESSPKPSRNPPLVDEICRILESSASPVAGKPAQKNGDKNVTAQEVTQVLLTLKTLSQGKSLNPSVVSRKNSVQYEEQIFYLSTYGSHQGLVDFYMKNEEWKTALTYILQEQLEPDVFLDSLFLPSYKSEQQERLKAEMLAVDNSLEIFKKYLCHACLHLQKSGYLHTLYDIQLFMHDFVRAAVTCIHLYQRDSGSYGELLNRAPYLHTALRHLEEEMSALNKKTKRLDYVMKLEPREVNRHMNTIWRQLEVAKFLGACESEGKPVLGLFPDQIQKENEVPTLFDGNPQKILLASLMIICGKNVPEGFGIAFRIMQDHQLDPEQVYILTGKKLSELGRINDIEVLIDCIKTSGVTDMLPTCDHVLVSCIPILSKASPASQDLEKLIKLINNVDFKITALIESRQLKSAYLLAVKHNRLDDVQRIMEVAEQLGQTVIKKICMKRLGQSPEGSICSSVPSCDST